MPKTDVMRLIHDKQREAGHAQLRQLYLFVELLRTLGKATGTVLPLHLFRAWTLQVMARGV